MTKIGNAKLAFVILAFACAAFANDPRGSYVQLTSNEMATEVNFSGDESKIFAQTVNGAGVWELQSANKILTIPANEVHGYENGGFSRCSGKMIVSEGKTSDGDSRVGIYDERSGAKLNSWSTKLSSNAPPAMVLKVQFSGDCTKLLVISTYPTSNNGFHVLAKVWDANSGANLFARDFTQKTGSILFYDINFDGSKVLLADGHHLMIFNTATKQVTYKIFDTTNFLVPLFSREHDLLYLMNDQKGELTAYDFSTRSFSTIAKIGDSNIDQISFVSDSSSEIVLHSTKYFHFLNLNTGTKNSYSTGISSWRSCINRNGTKIVQLVASGGVSLYDVKSQKSTPLDFITGDFWMNCAINNSGDKLLIGTAAGGVRLYTLQ